MDRHPASRIGWGGAIGALTAMALGCLITGEVVDSKPVPARSARAGHLAQHAADDVSAAIRRLRPSVEGIDGFLVQWASSTSLPISDHCHCLLGLGGDFLRADGVRECEWISRHSSGGGGDGRVGWIVKGVGGWFVVRRRGIGLWENGEAHVGQVVCDLAIAGVGDSDLTLRSPDGSAITLRALSISCLDAIQADPEVDVEFVVRGLLEWAPRDAWISGSGRRFSLDDLAIRLLERPPGKGPCFGTHVIGGLAAIQHSSLVGELPSSTRSSVESRLRSFVSQTLTSVGDDGWIAPPTSLPDWIAMDFKTRFAYQAHCTECLVDALPAETIRSDPHLALAVLRLATEMTSRPAEVSPTDLCHARRALRKFYLAADAFSRDSPSRASSEAVQATGIRRR